jgi:hypothetical protein
MVTICDYKKRQNADGKEFFTLTLMGGIEFVQSSVSGNFYATAWKANITSTFSEEICKSLIGTKLPGEIQKVESEPYQYRFASGETIMLTHKFKFNPHPNNATMEEVGVASEIEEVAIAVPAAARKSRRS